MDVNLIRERLEAVKTLTGSINTHARDGDFVVGAFSDSDQLFIETSDGKGFLVSLGPLTQQDVINRKKKLGIDHG